MESETDISVWPDALPTPKAIGRRHKLQSRNSIVQMDSTRSRSRRVFEGMLEVIDVQWAFTIDEFDTFKTYFEDDLENGENVFEMTTYEPSHDPLFIYEVVRIYAFWEGRYTFDHMDNCHMVNASLLVNSETRTLIDTPDQFRPPVEPPSEPPLDPHYESVCRDVFYFDIPFTDTTQEYVIQIAESEDGPWYDHIWVSCETPEEISSGTARRRLNNDYRGLAWFQVIDELLNVVLSATNPLASVIAPPDVAITNVTNVLETSGRGLWHAGPDVGDFTYPYSNRENAYINASDVYIVPRGRYEFASDEGNTNFPFDPNIVSITGEAGATHKWTRDGNDPTEDTAILRLNGYDDNAAASRTDFNYSVRARSFLGDCQSPMTLILVDKRVGQWNNVETVGLFQLLSGSCDLPRNDLNGIPYESGASCNVNYGGTEEFETFEGNNAIAQGTVSTGGPDNLLYYRAQDVDESLDYLGWTNHLVSTNFFDFSSISHTRPSVFDGYPVCYTFVVVGIGNIPGAGIDVASSHYSDVTVFGATITTEDGVSVPMAEAGSQSTTDLLASYIDLPGVWKPFGLLNPAYLTKYDMILTLHHDFKFFRDEDYEPPSAPDVFDPQEPFSGFYDDFENYNESSSADTDILAEGSGWGAGWVIETITPTTGEETWETYTVADYSEDSTSLTGGEGWSGAWTLEAGNLDIYEDTFEAYPDGALDPFNSDEGDGWGGPWVMEVLAGFETWETYADSANADADTLNAGTLWTSNAWVIGSP